MKRVGVKRAAGVLLVAAIGFSSRGCDDSRDACEIYSDHFASTYTLCGVPVISRCEFECYCSDSKAALARCLDQCVEKISCGCVDDLPGTPCDPAKGKAYDDCVYACLK